VTTSQPKSRASTIAEACRLPGVVVLGVVMPAITLG
jgi:hypothetical protein